MNSLGATGKDRKQPFPQIFQLSRFSETGMTEAWSDPAKRETAPWEPE